MERDYGVPFLLLVQVLHGGERSSGCWSGGWTALRSRRFWLRRDFDLRIPKHAGNCVFCFMKGTRRWPMNFENRTIWTGDNLDVLRGLNSESVDLIYLDPPFNSNRRYAAPIGSKAAGAEFKDTWHWSDVDAAWLGELADEHPKVAAAVEAAGLAHSKGMKSYILMMAVRLIEMKRVLKSTGSIYLHCDPTANSYLRMLMDSVFGQANMRNEIVWCYTGPGSPKMRQFNRKHDTLYWYSMGKTWVFNKDAVSAGYVRTPEGFRWGKLSVEERASYERKGKVPETWWAQAKGNGLAVACRSKKQYVGYPTQKPLALLERVIKASSNEGDVVLDPFCGCATTCVAAESLDRRWIGIDLSELAIKLVGSSPDMVDVIGLGLGVLDEGTTPSD